MASHMTASELAQFLKKIKDTEREHSPSLLALLSSRSTAPKYLRRPARSHTCGSGPEWQEWHRQIPQALRRRRPEQGPRGHRGSVPQATAGAQALAAAHVPLHLQQSAARLQEAQQEAAGRERDEAKRERDEALRLAMRATET